MEDLFAPPTPGRPSEKRRRHERPSASRSWSSTSWSKVRARPLGGTSSRASASLKAITFSASVPAILDVAALFEDVEITFGSERVLSRELAALEQATTATGYRFTDALADQKAFIERFVRPALSRRGERLLERVQDGSLRFRLLRETPSHAKLYLLAGDERFRVIAGSANLSLAAFSGRQRETFFVADGEADYRRFLGRLRRERGALRSDRRRPSGRDARTMTARRASTCRAIRWRSRTCPAFAS